MTYQEDTYNSTTVATRERINRQKTDLANG